MEQPFNIEDFVAQDQLLFGIDEVRGDGSVQYANTLTSNQVYHHLQYDPEAYVHISTSPDFIPYSTQSIPLNVSETVCHNQAWGGFSGFEPLHHSFANNVAADNSPFQGKGAWNSPPTFQNSLDHSFSPPVDIPIQSNDTQFGYLSPTSTVGTYFSQSSWNSSNTPMSRTASFAESLASSGTAVEESTLSFTLSTPPGREMLSTSPLSMIEYRPNGPSHRLTPAIAPGAKRPRGRRGPLDESQRKRTAHMRNVKACDSCRARKAKCDPGIPCRQCISYFKHALIHHPCRGQQFEDIADKLLHKGHIFPRKRTLGTDFGVNFRILPNYDFTIYLTIGFGEALEMPAQVVAPHNFNKFSAELLHQHVVYSGSSTECTVQKQYIFPALLKNPSELKVALDKHLARLIDDPGNFACFPAYYSQLAILNDIHDFYVTLGEVGEEKQARKLLGQAFKLLISIHIGGDTRVSNTLDSRRILDLFFSPTVQEKDVVPCYIRSQLGDVFSKLAVEYMKEVLLNLQIECLDKSCSRFPLVISTFIVLLMAVESIQHKTHRDNFHLVQDGAEVASGTIGDEIDGIDDLLKFYKNCFGRCHRERLLSTIEVDQRWSKPNGSSPFKDGDEVVLHIREGIQRALPYLTKRSQESLNTSGGDITIFFDRLVARLLLLQDHELYIQD